MKYARSALIVITVLIVPGGMIVLIPLLKKWLDQARARYAAQREIRANTPRLDDGNTETALCYAGASYLGQTEDTWTQDQQDKKEPAGVPRAGS